MASSRKRFVLAIVCGVVAAVLLGLYANDLRMQATSSRSQALANYGGEQVEVLVATRDIAAGETLDATNVSYQIWLVDLLPAGVARDTVEVYGMVTAVAILKNEPIALAKLGERATQIIVPDGLCALSIAADDVQAVGGALAPGMIVDIYAVGVTSVTLVAQNVLILETSNGFGVSTTSSNSGSSSLFGTSSARASLKWVTVAVDAKTVQELLAAARDRKLCLVLPGGDTAKITQDALTTQNTDAIGDDSSNASSSASSDVSSDASSSDSSENSAAGTPFDLTAEENATRTENAAERLS